MIVQIAKSHAKKVSEHRVSSILRRNSIGVGDKVKVYETLEVNLDYVPNNLHKYYKKWASELEAVKTTTNRRGCSLRFALSVVRRYKEEYGTQFVASSFSKGYPTGTTYDLMTFYRDNYDKIEVSNDIPENLKEFLQKNDSDSEFIREVKSVCSQSVLVDSDLRYVWFLDNLMTKSTKSASSVGDSIVVEGEVVSVKDVSDVYSTYLFTIKTNDGKFFYKKGSKTCLDKVGYSPTNHKVLFRTTVKYVTKQGDIFVDRIAKCK